MPMLYEGEKQLLSEMKDLDQRSAYILLKYWVNRPRKWNTLWRELESAYKDDAEWEYLVTKDLEGNGLNSIGEYAIDKNTGDEYLVDPARTWVTSNLGKKHIEDDFFNLGYKETPQERRANNFSKLSCVLSLVAISISILVYLYPSENESDKSTNQEIESLKMEIESTSREVLRIKSQTDSLIRSSETSEHYR